MTNKFFVILFVAATVFNLSPFFVEIKGRSPASLDHHISFQVFTETNPALLIH